MGASVMIFCVVMLGLCLSTGLASGLWSLHPQDQTVEEGSSVSFNCSTTVDIQCGGNSWIFWQFKSKLDSSSKLLSTCENNQSALPAHASVSWDGISHLYQLNISNVTSSDEGTYYCSLFHKQISKSGEAQLDVKAPTAPSPTCPPQNDNYPQCSVFEEADHLFLSCKQPKGSQTTLTWFSSNNETLVSSNEEQTQGNFHNVTHVLRNSDNCERFTCRAEGNCSVSQCEVGPFKLPVSISPLVMKLVESGGPDIFHCDTDALPSSYKWLVRSNGQPPQAVDGETDQFELLEAGKSLRVKASSVADNGTEVKCEVEYQPTCSQSSDWSVLLISTQDSGTPSSAISPIVSAHSSVGLIVWCFVVAGVCLAPTVIPHVY